MLKKNLLIQLRAIAKKPMLFLINIFGLSVGIAACMLCYLHIDYERSFDRYHQNAENIYRLVNGDMAAGEGWVKVSAPIPPRLASDIPEIAQYARFTKITYDTKVTVDFAGNFFNEEHFYMADPALLDMFDIPLVSGSRGHALEDINSVIISESMAQKIFGDQDPMGEIINVDGQFDFVVKAIFADIPLNSHMTFDFLIDFANLERMFKGTSLTANWGQFNYFAYVQLNADAQELVVEEKIANTHIDLGRNEAMGLEDVNLQKVTDIHFQANRGNLKASYDVKYLYVYGAVSAAILLISLINFINLTIAGSTKRIKEVGVRKAIGARKSQLVSQYISETFITALASMVAAMFIVKFVFLKMANQIFDSAIALDFSQPNLLVTVVLLVVFISISSGCYIAIFVTSFQPIHVLKGTFKIGKKGTGFKNLLLGAQFVISIAMIMSSIFIYKQLTYLKGKDLGLSTEQVISVSLYNQEARAQADLVKRELLQLKEVESASVGRFTAGAANWHQTVWWEGQTEAESMSIIIVDKDFVKTMSLNLVEGTAEHIEKELAPGEYRYIINASARDLMGWDDALDKSFSAFGKQKKAPIAGVVADFNYRSLHNTVDPVVLAYYDGAKRSELLIKVNSSDYTEVLETLEHKFHAVLPDTPFAYHFLDDKFEQLYQSENRTSKIVGFLTMIAIMLALLGLYGLLSFAIVERTKEIAIRKILGINLPDTMVLLSSGYAKLLLISNVIAIPIVWYGMRQWLTNFSYRIDMNVLEFVAVSVLVWLFLAITISLSAFHVNKIDAVSGLRYE
jgi:putative ABC transport system permease protein